MKTYGEIFSIASWAKVEFHPYRTANPNLVLMSIDRDSEAGRELEALLYERAAEHTDTVIQRDNHVCFSFGTYFGNEGDNNTKLVVKISDGDISIGVGLRHERWSV